MLEATRVQDVIERGMRGGEHLGAQVAACINGELVLDTAYGEARSGEALTPGHLMLWMSAGKPVTAVALLQQVEAGTVHLDDPVAEYIEGFEQFGKEDITLRHVLTHTGGFRIMAERYPQMSWEESIAAVCRSRLEPGWVPGQKAGYHVHTGWYALGRVVEVASGEALAGYVRRQIFEPLGMSDCWLSMPRDVNAGYGTRVVELLDTSGDNPTGTGYADADWCAGVRPGANLYGPANQLVRFYGAMLDGEALLSRQTVADAVRRHREGMEDKTFRAVMDWGLGFMINSVMYGNPNVPYGLGPHASENAFGHGGNQCSVAFTDPAHGLAAAVLFNGQPGEPRHQSRNRAVLAALYEDLRLV